MDYTKYSNLDLIKYYYKNFKRDKELFVFVLIFISSLCNGILPLLAVIFPKFIVDAIGANDLSNVLFYILMFGGLSLVLSSIHLYLRGIILGRTLAARVRKATELGQRFRFIDFKFLEDSNFHKRRNEAQAAYRNSQEGYEGVLLLVIQALPEFFTVVGFIYILGIFNPLIILVSLLAASVQLWLALKAKKYTLSKHLEKTDYERKSQYFYRTAQDYSYAKDIRINKLSDSLNKKYKEKVSGVLGILKKTLGYECKLSLFDVFFLLITNGLTYYLVIKAYFDGLVSLGTITMTIMTVLGITLRLQTLFRAVSRMKEEADKTKKYMAFEDQDCFYETLDSGGEKIDFNNISVEFKDVYFKYPSSEEYILKGISFKANELSKLALVGINGAGKTTIVKLIAGLYLPTKGEILINGYSTKELNRTYLREQLAIVFQDVNVYAATVLENVAGLNPSAEERQKALDKFKQVGLLDKINSYNQKENQILLKSLDPTGVEFSGGESQKLSIARALYKENTKLIILDEPTASLDAIAEKEIYEKFNDLVNNRTAIMISHRLASTRFCDNILFLENGIIIEEGSHEELMDISDGKYKEMFETQGKYYKQGVENNEI